MWFLSSYDYTRITFQDLGDVAGWGKRLKTWIPVTTDPLSGADQLYFSLFTGVCSSGQVCWTVFCRFLLKVFFNSSLKFVLSELVLSSLAGRAFWVFDYLWGTEDRLFLYPTCCVSAPSPCDCKTDKLQKRSVFKVTSLEQTQLWSW